ncbi:MAG: aminotransferase class V-fold PLP-dependent enzyme [Rhodoplanes sp.]|uniref:aminotransferase class V-fold PLP-dependent enzyme n=1 Tax=Rhodoplanes sp. TaxID=1968906 RepID=UPI0017983F8F|nr:aminotransferase class V-fold PLP-dependent enzyme [Rhodoplanes sp.]NVO12950.1 aminotransferase class V-fold PLP-dependent enzyme [Rhodoplanes sp.]
MSAAAGDEAERGAAAGAPPGAARPAALTDGEVAALRADTPAVGHHVHLNHASASLAPGAVIAAMEQFLAAERAMGVHAAIEAHAGALDEVRRLVARLVGAEPASIAFADTATRAFATALGALVAGGARRLVTVRNEWGPNLLNAGLLGERAGLAVEVLPVDAQGRVEPDRLIESVRAGDVVALPLVPTASGLVNDVAALAAELRARDALVMIDAAQAVGQMPVDAAALGADVLVFPSRKWLRGPKGVAVLSVSPRALARAGSPSSVDMAGVRWDRDDRFAVRDGALRFESFEFNPAVRLGLGAAVRLALSLGPARIAVRIRDLVAHAVRCAEAAGLPPPLEAGSEHGSGILTWADPQRDIGRIATALQASGVRVAVIGAEHARLALADRGVTAVLRASIHAVNSPAEIDAFVARLAAGWRR